jgi:hypothetical protein
MIEIGRLAPPTSDRFDVSADVSNQRFPRPPGGATDCHGFRSETPVASKSASLRVTTVIR